MGKETRKLSLFNIAVLISGSGSNLQAVIDATENGFIPNAKVALVVSNREGVLGLQRAQKHGIENLVISKNEPKKLLDTLIQKNINGVVLAGYLAILPSEITDAYTGRVINIHPALLPDFGGLGYYGINVHKAVLEAGVKTTGATAHIVDSGVDTGTILIQGEVPVMPDDTAESLQKRVLKTEHKVLVKAVKAMVEGELSELAKKPEKFTAKRVLVIGSGGREHAIGIKLAQNPDTELYFAPGNGGTASIGENISIEVDDVNKLADFASKYNIYLTVIGPELPLTLGLADIFRERGLAVFGPKKLGAQLEGSKAFAKAFMQKYDIPTAKYEIIKSVNEGLKTLSNYSFPVVIKADGLSAGKGVIICADIDEAELILKDMLETCTFGEAGRTVIIEEFLTGKEVSLLCFTDGITIVPMETASDYKRALDGDKGPNTGGMGCISPSPYYVEGIADDIVRKTLYGIIAEGFDYRGVIYIGLILTPNGPMVLEYNARFGDPETQVLLPRLDIDLLELMDTIADKRLSRCKPVWKKESAVCVVLASKGYPGKYDTGFEIEIPDGLQSSVFHAGSTLKNNKPVTNGGRVLTVTALGKSLDQAREIVYKDIEKINFKGKTYRTDIADFRFKV